MPAYSIVDVKINNPKRMKNISNVHMLLLQRTVVLS